VVTIPITRAIEAADRGDIVDAKTLAALLLVRG